MEKLTKQRAQELLHTTTTEPHLFQHALAVSAAMGAMAKHFGEDAEYWEAVGILHDYDYEQHPDEHLAHTEAPLREAGVDDESIRAILAHGWGICTDTQPLTSMEKSLYAVDELTGLISANARMRPTGLAGMAPKSVKKKFKDKGFAAKIDRGVINQGCEMLGMELGEVIALCIEGLAPHAGELGINGKGEQE